MRRRFFAATLALTLIPAAAATARAQGSDAAPVASGSRTVWDGVYDTVQAERGHAAYSAHCASCHRDDLTAYNSLLVGPRFMEKYRETSLHLLFDKTKATMPRNAAGSLSDQAYLDIVSYVLQVNDFPPGAAELRIDDLTRVRLIGKGGPEPVPNFSLVQVFGCLGRRDEEWMLTGASEPARTGLPQPTSEELASVRSPSLGNSTFGLLASAAYSPGDQAGRVVEVRGFLIRRQNGDRINVTSIETVGPACSQ